MMFLRHRLSIRAQLLLLVLSVMLPAAGIFAYYVADESQQAREAAYAKVKILADNTQSNLDQLLREHEAVLSRLAARPLVRALDARNCDPIIAESVRLLSVLTYPIRDDQGKVSGLIAFALDLLQINERVFQRSPQIALQMVLD